MSNSHSHSKLIKDNVLMNATSITEKLIFFVINVIISRYLTKEQFGEYATALGYATFFSLFSTLGVIHSLVRAISLDPENEGKHFGNVVAIKTLLAVFTYILMVLSLLTITNYSRNTIQLILILGLVRIGNEYMSTFFSFYNANQKFILTCIYIFLFDLFFLGSTAFVVFAKGGYFDFSLWRLVVVAAFILILTIHTTHDYKISFDLSLLKNFVVDTIPFGISTIFENVIQRLNIIILTLFKGETEGGIFSNGYIFIVSLMFIPQNFDKVIIPFLYRKFKNDRASGVQAIFDTSTRILGILSFFAVLIAVNFGDDIIPLVFSSKYDQSINTFKLSSFCLLFQFTISGPVITSLDRQHARTTIMVIASIINIVSCFFLSYFFEAEGLALAMTITYASMWILYTAYLAFFHNIRLKNSLFTLIKLSCTLGLLTFFHSIITRNPLLSSFFARICLLSILYALAIYYFVLTKPDLEIFTSMKKRRVNS